jgi:two-component system cell cycle sensor histidine kinase/response regulator CckA
MSISHQIEAVYQRALQIREQATALYPEPDLLEDALKELYNVLEELRTADEELHEQNQTLRETRHQVEVERHRYRTLFELAPDGYLVTDRQGKIHYANRAAATLFGCDPDALMGKPLVVLIEPGDQPRFQQQLLRISPASDWYLSLKRLKADPVVAAVRTTYLGDPQREAATILWSLRDVTERQRLEQQLQAAHDQLEQQVAERTAELARANAQLRQEIDQNRQAEQTIRHQAALIDIATDAIYVQDGDHRIIFWSQGATKLYGWTEAEAVGQNAALLLTDSAPDTTLATLMAEADSGSWQGEMMHRTKAGNQVFVLSRQTQMPQDDELAASTLVVNTDITEKKQLQAEFFQAQRMESLGTLARGIAHDFNNLLSPVRIVPQMLLKRLPNLDANSRDLVQMLLTVAERGMALSRQILTFAGRYEVSATTLDVPGLIQEVQSLLQHTLPKTIALQVDVAPDLALIWSDKTLIHQVLMNLCVNAQQAMANGGTLSIAAQNTQVKQPPDDSPGAPRAGAYVVVTVADTGTGIAPEVIDRIFDPFFTTKPPGQGTGLGLSTVARIVKDCGGFVRVASEVGVGSTFQVYLPVTDKTTSEHTAGISAKALPGQNQQVLIVEDDAQVRMATETLLKNFNYRTLGALDGLEATEIYRKYHQEIDAILLDLNMPYMDGLDTLKQLKTIDPTVPILVMSGVLANRSASIEAGANAFMAKPYDLAELLSWLHLKLVNPTQEI